MKTIRRKKAGRQPPKRKRRPRAVTEYFGRRRYLSDEVDGFRGPADRRFWIVRITDKKGRCMLSAVGRTGRRVSVRTDTLRVLLTEGRAVEVPCPGWKGIVPAKHFWVPWGL